MKKRKGIGIWLLLFAVVIFAVVIMAMAVWRGKEKGVYFSSESAYRFEDTIVYSVFMREAGSYKVSLEGSVPDGLFLEINGVEWKGEWKKNTAEVLLNKGVNSIALTASGAESEPFTEGIHVEDAVLRQEAGANLLYTTYEAEEGETNGKSVTEGREYYTFASEASKRGYAELREKGEFVSVVLTEPANALVIRFCIPDSEDGTGLKTIIGLSAGEDYREVELTSAYSWVYGPYPWNNNPESAKDGPAHMFFDDVRVELDKVYPAGTTITLRKEEKTEAEYCIIDFIEGEEIDAPLEMPENALNVEAFGAVSGDGKDDAAAIADCIKEALVQEKEVYIPKGEFEIKNPVFIQGIVLDKDNITIRGAGMWHTVLKGDAAGFAIRAGHISFYDFSMIGDVKSRKNSIDPPAFNLVMPLFGMRDIRIQNVWIEHYKVGLWADVVKGISMMGCRIRNTFADGINLCGGTSDSVLTQNELRNTGDDGIAMFSRGVLVENIKIMHNTVSLPWLANNIALYGGKDIVISHNLLKDTITHGSGINISTNFMPQIFEGRILIEENQLYRTGSYGYDGANGGIWMNTVEGYDNKAECIIRNNYIADSSYYGISFYNSGRIEHMMIENNRILDSGSYGIFVDKNAEGVVGIRENEIEGKASEHIYNSSQESFQFVDKLQGDVMEEVEIEP